MKINMLYGRSKGIALVLSLLILLVLTVVGVAAMNSTIMQERMAGNARTQADVFEKSSQGVSRALDYFYEYADELDVLDDDENDYNLACGQLFGGTSDTAWTYPSSGWTSVDGGNPQLEQKMYCCQDWAQASDGSWVENPSKLYVLNKATFLGGADGTESLAMREIEVELAEAEPDDPTCSICAPGTIGTVKAPNSNKFGVDGACGAAIVAETADDAARFIGGIPDGRLGQYNGGVVAGNMARPWGEPESLAEFVFWAKLGLGDEVPGVYIDGNADGSLAPYGTEDNPQITYIDGNADLGGNDTGNGIMIVRGTLSWNGTPAFNGLLITMGGGLTIDGGGKGGNYEPGGSMVITQVVDESGNPPDLYGREVLNFQVAMDDSNQQVKMYHPPGSPECDGNDHDDAAGVVCGGDLPGGSDLLSYKDGPTHLVPERPVLLGSGALLGLASNPELIYFYDEDPAITDDADRPKFFLAADYGEHSQGEELPAEPDGSGNFDIKVEIETGVVSTTKLLPQPDTDGDGTPDPTRDAYGRMIPEFVWPDNYPDEYGYNPNHWDWDFDTADPHFEWGTTNFDWDGGGGEQFKYDCRKLQRVRHELLCEQKKLEELPDPNSDFFKDPESHYEDYCAHFNPGVEFTDEADTDNGAADGNYFSDYDTVTTGLPDIVPENQKAWHMWSPSCDCLGISVETDMIVSGWRENLGWRDAANFQGCEALPSPDDST